MKGMKICMGLAAAAMLALGAVDASAQEKVPAQTGSQPAIVDTNSDGICDITGERIGSGAQNARGQQAGRGNRNGLGDGTGNQGSKPGDGTGYGSQSGKRSGPQDCTQPRNGQGNRTGAARMQAGGRGGRP